MKPEPFSREFQLDSGQGLRGWPFGTLLLWEIAEDEVDTIPNRPFWRVVSRVPGEINESNVGKKDRPGTFKMILDGQQRLQSLLLALSSDQSGFVLPDRDWFPGLELDRPKGASSAHWSWGQLCLDLDVYRNEISNADNPQAVDYTRALQWVICSDSEGISRNRKSNHRSPLPHLSAHSGRFIRFSRLWKLAQPGHASERQYKTLLQSFLVEHQVPTAIQTELTDSLAELLVALGALKTTPVHFLKLNQRTDTIKREDYDDAIVNIFTRLNTGGRALTTQEITFAWIKKKWNSAHTNGKDAVTCFDALRDELKDADVALSLDELVRAVSTVWSVLKNDGTILTPRDLLKGEVVSPMASTLDERWSELGASFVTTSGLLASLGLHYQDQFESFNGLIVLWAWRYLGNEWLRTHRLGTMERDSFNKAMDSLVTKHAPRWIALSHWSGRWATSAVKNFESYAKTLSATWQKISTLNSGADTATELDSLMAAWLTDLEKDAVVFLNQLEADDRSYVRQYYLPLWIWHRLDAERAKISQVQLRDEKKKRSRVALDVDHTVSCSFWEKTALPALATKYPNGEIPDSVANTFNQLGNCMLLETNFNISKSDSSLTDFTSRVYEFKNGNPTTDEWREALAIEDEQFDPNGFTPDQLAAAIEKRTKNLKDELIEFVQGKKSYCAPAFRPQSADATPSVAGEWITEFTAQYEGKPYVYQAQVTLRQIGKSVEGDYEYTEDGELRKSTLKGEFNGPTLTGVWSEPGLEGKFIWDFDTGTYSFAGHWGNGSRARKDQPWSGTKK